MLTSIFRQHFLLLTCASTVCKTMCGVAAGCTKSSITAHFAVQGNIAGAWITALGVCVCVVWSGWGKCAGGT